MARKADKIAALCSAAIGAIYVAGYLVTDPGSSAQALVQSQAASAMAPVNSPDSHTAPNNFTPPNGQKQGRDHGGRFGGGAPDQGQGQRGDASVNGNSNQASTTTPSGGSSNATTQGRTTPASYKDGTYTGMGSNRIGSVEVAVTIQGGKIAAVEITNCDTHYPQSRIDGLPAQAVQRQSSNVDTVSGATKSCDDFRTAMNQALAQAQA